jgi:hypothetical protein
LAIGDSKAFIESVSSLLPPDPIFRGMVLDALKGMVSQNTTTIRIDDFLRVVRNYASASFDSQTVARLDARLRSMVPDFSPALTTPATASGELGGERPRYRPDDLLPLPLVEAGLRPH